MIILDTNVVSELTKSVASTIVLLWISTRDRAQFYTTSITQADILHGVRASPAGRRRKAIENAAEAMFVEDLAGRILPFDSDAARAYADVVSERRRSGRPISQLDAQIAAVTRAASAVLATRNVKNFERCDISIVDPWLHV